MMDGGRAMVVDMHDSQVCVCVKERKSEEVEAINNNCSD